jgi:DNA-3-methyladenine glycosylase I
MGLKELLMLLVPLVVGSLLPSASSSSRYYFSRGVTRPKDIIITWWLTTTTTAATTRMSRTTRASSANKEALSSSSLSESEKKKKPGVTRKKQVAPKVGKPKAPPGPPEPGDTAVAARGGGGGGPWYHAFTKGDAEYDAYMKNEWGIEKRGDVALFEKLCLEGAQSGLSWLTILRKREAYRRVFYHFDPRKVAQMTPQHVDDILQMQPADKNNARDVVVRHRGKLEAVINNAKCLVQMQQEGAGNGGSGATKTNENALDTFLWSFVEDKPILNRWNGSINSCPSKTAESEAMSKALKKMGWKFVGPTTCYAMMQAVGMVIDHPMNSPEWKVAQKRLQERPGRYQDAAGAAN